MEAHRWLNGKHNAWPAILLGIGVRASVGEPVRAVNANRVRAGPGRILF
jgi:hypothetical protein